MCWFESSPGHYDPCKSLCKLPQKLGNSKVAIFCLPDIASSSGINAPETLFFVKSTDFGDTWQTIEMPDSPSGIQVNDMVTVEVEGREVLYLGTNKGVFSYTFEE